MRHFARAADTTSDRVTRRTHRDQRVTLGRVRSAQRLWTAQRREAASVVGGVS